MRNIICPAKESRRDAIRNVCNIRTRIHYLFRSRPLGDSACVGILQDGDVAIVSLFRSA